MFAEIEVMILWSYGGENVEFVHKKMSQHVSMSLVSKLIVRES